MADNPRVYRTFTRTWYRRNEHGALVPQPGPQRTHDRNLTYDEARRSCEEYNRTHRPGTLSRKMEFTS